MNDSHAIGAGLLLTAAGDVATTYYGLEYAGLVERNPTAAYFIDAFGPLAMVPLSLAMLGATVATAGVLHALYGQRWPRAWYAPCLVVIALNGLVTAQNAFRIAGA